MIGINNNLSTYPVEFKETAKKVFNFKNNVCIMLENATAFGAPEDDVSLQFLRQALNFVKKGQDGNDLFQNLSNKLPKNPEAEVIEELFAVIQSGEQRFINPEKRACGGDIEDLGAVSGCSNCQNKCTPEYDLGAVAQILNG